MTMSEHKACSNPSVTRILLLQVKGYKDPTKQELILGDCEWRGASAL